MKLQEGPNVVEPYEVLQPLADSTKLFIKKLYRPLTTFTSLFIIAHLYP